jgi:hypothetical protein
MSMSATTHMDSLSPAYVTCQSRAPRLTYTQFCTASFAPRILSFSCNCVRGVVRECFASSFLGPTDDMSL